MINTDFAKSKGYDIEKLAIGIGLPEDYFDAVAPVCEMILRDCEAEFDSLKADMRNTERYDAITAKLGIDTDLVWMAIYMLLAVDARRVYEAKGHTERIYYDSMREITIWSKVCMKDWNHVGIHGQLDWITRFFTNDLVRLGRLEFEIIPLHPNIVWEKHGVCAKSGDPVINIHIPEDGGLKNELVQDSFKQAYRYFGCKDKAVFICSTWLLWPGNREYMHETSNILRFMDNFDIIQREDQQNHRDLWRVFGKRESYVPAELPRDTELQRRLSDYLATHDMISGRGLGIFAHDGENLYN